MKMLTALSVAPATETERPRSHFMRNALAEPVAPQPIEPLPTEPELTPAVAPVAVPEPVALVLPSLTPPPTPDLATVMAALARLEASIPEIIRATINAARGQVVKTVERDAQGQISRIIETVVPPQPE